MKADQTSPVEVIIACHNPERAVGRAVASVLEGSGDCASVTVVAHNTTVESLKRVIAAEHRDRTRFLHLDDGTRSPAGPFQLGIDKALSPWVSIMGSDDHLQPGAVRAWLNRTKGADAVIARVIYQSGSIMRTPPVRPLPRKHRNAVRDRLFYRSAPLGLMNREFLVNNKIALSQGLSVGEDLPFSALLWSRARVTVQSTGAAYVVGEGADDRVTMRLAPIAEELKHFDAVWNPNFLSSFAPAQIDALGTKYLRIHVFGAAYYRAVQDEWQAGDRVAIAHAAEQVLKFAPWSAEPLSIADRRLLDAILDPSAPTSEVNRMAMARRRFGHPTTLVPKNLTRILDREAPLRFMAASALIH